MASFKLKFRPSTAKDKTGTLYFQVIHRRSTRTVCTDYHVTPEEWDGQTSSVRVTGTPERQAKLRLIVSKVRWDCRQIASLITEKEQALVEYTADDIASAFRRLPPCQTWFGFIHGMVAKKLRMGRTGTAKTYLDALASFSRFRDGEDIAIDALDAELMNRYEAWLKGRGVKRNSSSCYLRTLRTLYRKAAEKGLTTDRDIFRHVFTGFAATAKRALPLDTIRAVRRLPLPEGSALAFARDMFMLGIYLQGISFVDMAYLRKDDIRNGLLQYSRRKTGQGISVGWEPAMQEIVDAYAHLTEGSPYLLPVITRQDGTERAAIRTDGTQGEPPAEENRRNGGIANPAHDIRREALLGQHDAGHESQPVHRQQGTGARESEDHASLSLLHRHGGSGESQPENDRQDFS